MNPGTKRKVFFIAGLILLVLLLSQCAIRRPPGGGPPDKTPPHVLSTFPAIDSVNVKDLKFLEIRFDESIDRASVTNQVWMLPVIPGGFSLKWKGSKTLRILLKDTLEANQTYLLTIGTGVKDLRGNRLQEPIVLPFSTGPHLDSGEIRGNVLSPEVKDVLIYVYRMSDTLREETIFKRRPRYYLPVKGDGSFHMKYLSHGRYRLYALDDRNKDYLYTLGTDRIGLPFMDVELTTTHQRIENFNFVLTTEDTLGPSLFNVKALHHHQFIISFNEEIKKQTTASVQVIDSTSGTPLEVKWLEVEGKDPRSLIVYTAEMKETKYQARVKGISDTSGNSLIPPLLEFNFVGSSQKDTLSPRLKTIIPEAGNRSVAYDSPITFQFTVPVDSNSLQNNFTLIAPDSSIVNGHWNWYSLLQPIYQPDGLLQKGARYQVHLNLSKVFDIYGRPYGDSLYQHEFNTLDWSLLGEISGEVTVQDTSWKQVIISAEALKGQKKYSLVSTIDKPFIIPFLPEGQYRVKAAIDISTNGRWDPGKSIPFRYSEPVLVFPDTVSVRKRWTTEGIDFQFIW